MYSDNALSLRQSLRVDPELAARYVASQLEKLELEPAGDNGTYFQTFRVMVGKEIGRRTQVSLRFSGDAKDLEFASDFQPMTFSAAGELSAPVVFAGYGVTAPEHDYDDYNDVDVEGKVVCITGGAGGLSADLPWKYPSRRCSMTLNSQSNMTANVCA